MAIINGTDASETLLGTAAADRINAFAGNDILIGGRGRDLMFGGNGADRFDIAAQYEILAGETYDGGLGFDQLFLNTSTTIDLSRAIITDVEFLKSRGAVTLLSAQLSAFTRVEAWGITLKDGGLVDLSDSAVFNPDFSLAAAGNIFTLSGTANVRYTVRGNVGNDIITGGEAGNDLRGGDGDDILTGGTGYDILTGGAGFDIVRGGNGYDRLVIAAASDLVAGELYDGGAGTDVLAIMTRDALDLTGVTIASVEELEVAGTVTLTRAHLLALDTIRGGTIRVADSGLLDMGDAQIEGATFVLADGANTVRMAGVLTGLTILGGSGSDRITGSDNPFSSDKIDGGAGADILSGGAGADTLTGGLGRDTLDGGAGNDLFLVNAQAELVAGEQYRGGAGYDRVYLTGMEDFDISRIVLGTDTEHLEAGSGVTMTAQQFSSIQRLSAGTIRLSTGGLADFSTDLSVGRQAYVRTIYLSKSGNELNLSGQWYDYTVYGSNRDDVIIGGLINTIFAGAGNDIIRGGDYYDTLHGGTGLDIVDGGASDDELIIESQNELVAGESYTGGDGHDRLIVGWSSGSPTRIDLSRVTIATIEELRSDSDIRLTAAQIAGFSVGDVRGETFVSTGGSIDLSGTAWYSPIHLSNAGNTITGVWSVVFGGIGADTISGGGELHGSGGADIISASVGSDTITGGRGRDIVDGGAGDDTLVIREQAEIFPDEIYRGGSGFDTLLLDVDGAPIRLSHAAIASDIERLESDGAVSLRAAQLAAFTSLETGEITLTSSGVVDFRAADVRTAVFTLFATGNTLDLTGQTDTAFTVNGGRGADTIRGGDHLDGDRIVGGAGNDVLTGGAGADVFVYTALNSGMDTITDFSGANGQHDTLAFEGLLAGTFAYRGAAAFSGSGNSEARFAGANSLQVDADGDGSADITITMLGLTSAGRLGTADFLWT